MMLRGVNKAIILSSGAIQTVIAQQEYTIAQPVLTMVIVFTLCLLLAFCLLCMFVNPNGFAANA